MSFLEVIGWTLTLACFPDIVANREVTTRIDNQGSVTMWQRGYLFISYHNEIHAH